MSASDFLAGMTLTLALAGFVFVVVLAWAVLRGIREDCRLQLESMERTLERLRSGHPTAAASQRGKLTGSIQVPAQVQIGERLRSYE